MNHQLQKLAEKRRHLIAQAASQRMLLADNAHAMRKPLAVVDKGVSVLRYIKHHPILIAGGGTAVLTIAKHYGMAKWWQRAWLAWQFAKKIKK